MIIMDRSDWIRLGVVLLLLLLVCYVAVPYL